MRHFHFPGLNGIRFLAAFLVLLDHTELIKGYLGLPTLWSETYSAHIGSTGVTIFFVLSGFLITYLLFMEKSIGPIHIQSFYIRRILRIWPLYYLIFILGFLYSHTSLFFISLLIQMRSLLSLGIRFGPKAPCSLTTASFIVFRSPMPAFCGR